MSAMSLLLLLLVVSSSRVTRCVPIGNSKGVQKGPPAEINNSTAAEEDQNYDRYLREVIDVLEKDQAIRDRIQSAHLNEIKSGKPGEELGEELGGHVMRTRLEELTRQEVTRLRSLLRTQHETLNGAKADHRGAHAERGNTHGIPPHELEGLISTATGELSSLDARRHAAFRRHELRKEHERRAALMQLHGRERAQRHEEQQRAARRHHQHGKINHPGSERQLKEVWESSDGLEPEDFDAKTFFKLHDSNSDGYLDVLELEAIFSKELEKMYDPQNTDDDSVEMEEERLRMREHVLNEVDLDKDYLVSMEEFILSTQSKDFHNDESWETLDEYPMFTEEELANFEREMFGEYHEFHPEDDLEEQQHEGQHHQEPQHHKEPQHHQQEKHPKQSPGQGDETLLDKIKFEKSNSH